MNLDLGESRRAILVELRRADVMTVDALVEVIGLSKTATRAHLIRMERDGVVARAAVEAEGRGRPPLAFTLTDQGASMLPSTDEALLSRLLLFLDENGGGELVRTFFEELWSERRRGLLSTLGTDTLEGTSLDARLAAVEASLVADHFMPMIERKSCSDGAEVVTVRECNCPFPAAARVSRIPCQLEIDFLSEVLGGKPKALSIASSRKGTCTFEFEVESEFA